MKPWKKRALVFGVAMVALRLIQGTLINILPSEAMTISATLLVLYLIGVVWWGLRDGRVDAAKNPDPDRREDLAMVWLLAGVCAGAGSGAIAWLIALVYQGMYAGGLVSELTTFAAFTALLIFVPAISGVAIGRWQVDRRGPVALPDADGSTETDVFAAVRADDESAPAQEAAPDGELDAATAAASVAVAVLERESAAEAAADAATEIIAVVESDPPTESFQPLTDGDQTEHGEGKA